jgi:hypothetical protein
LKTRPKLLVIILFVVTFCTCIDPYKPSLSGVDKYLVVEGLVTNELAPYEIKLSRTIAAENSTAEKVTDAVVTITDGTGKKTTLINYGDGSYKTNINDFTGAVGKTYTLYIVTSDGKEYQSEPCTMLPVPEIESIYYSKDQEFSNNQSELHKGIRIFLNSKPNDEPNMYYRWAFDETWKFRLPNPQKFNFINDSVIVPIASVKEFCWKNSGSSEILTSSMDQFQSGIIKKLPITFISPDLSDRLSIEYSILVKQFSISKKEYDFWENLKKVNESGGDIFGSQPFPVISNISNVNNSAERILGYFQVSAVSQKRIFITFSELLGLDLSLYDYKCVRIETSPADLNTMRYSQLLTFQDVYNMYIAKQIYSFVEPIYDPVTDTLQKLVFTTRACSDCEMTGTLKKPDFWIDLK